MDNTTQNAMDTLGAMFADEVAADIAAREPIAEENETVEEIEAPEEVSEDIEDETTDDETESEDDQEEVESEDNLLTKEYFEDTFVDVNGEKVNLGELTKGYLRQSDFTKKTQALAEQRKEVEEYAQKVEVEANSRIKQRFEMVYMDVEKRLSQFNSIDWKTLSRTNPNDYTALKAEYDETVKEAQTIQQSYNEILEKQRAEGERALQMQAVKTNETLKETIPGWNKNLYQDIAKYAVENGLREDVIANIVDAPSLTLIYKAYMFDKNNSDIKAKVTPKEKPSVKSKLKPKAKVDVSTKEVKDKEMDKIRKAIKTTDSKQDREKLEVNLIRNLLKE